MRLIYGIALFVLAGALGICSVIARKSGKAMGRTTSTMLLWLIPPVIGNAVIILSGTRILSTAGAYMYYIGMDFLTACMLHFTFRYCSVTWKSTLLRNIVYFMLLADVIQLLLNPVWHHAFDLIPVQVDGFDYYSLEPHPGQHFHRLVNYGIVTGILAVFAVKMIRAPRLQTERYSVILVTIVREIISLARQLNIVSLTEGVETEKQYDQLRDLGCQMYQGFYFAKPMPLEEFRNHYTAAE